MKKVICFGEALIDMLSNRVGGAAADSPETFTKYPGGAPANVAVAIAKLGGRAHFAGKVGADMFGDCLRAEMDAAGVHTEALLQTEEAHTALAFVSLDAQGERSFEFYRSPSADLLFRPEEFADDWFEEPGLFHFCSNTLTEEPIRAATLAGVRKAKATGFLISFDVNLRANLWPRDVDPLPHIWDAIAQADLLKLCVEELAFLCRNQSEDEVIETILASGVDLVLITDGGNPLRYIGRGLRGCLQPPATQVVDSTAAGDAFTGGVLFALARGDRGPEWLEGLHSAEPLEEVLALGMACGAFTVTRKGAFAALPTAADLQPVITPQGAQ